jgi:hypothetical protein
MLSPAIKTPMTKLKIIRMEPSRIESSFEKSTLSRETIYTTTITIAKINAMKSQPWVTPSPFINVLYTSVKEAGISVSSSPSVNRDVAAKPSRTGMWLFRKTPITTGTIAVGAQ